MKHFIWLFGENEGKTMNNNSFYFWQHVVNKGLEVQCYFVVTQNARNQLIFKTLSSELQEKVIFKNSQKHTLVYKQADMLFVTSSYKDVIPEHYFRFVRRIKKPVIYLQHGTLGIKKIGYTGKSYWNNMFRFLVYNPDIAPKLIAEQGFEPYQIHLSEAHPRYKKLIELNERVVEKKQILWFITWREYLENEEEMNFLIDNIKKVVQSEQLLNHLEKSDSYFKICLHAFIPESVVRKVSDVLHHRKLMIVDGNQIDVMEEVANSSMLITDYSSLGFDFTFLKKPVLIYQFDQDRYLDNRDTYCHVREAFAHLNCKNVTSLIDKVINRNDELNAFFTAPLKLHQGLERIKRGQHIDDFYRHFLFIQQHLVTILDCGNIDQLKLLELARKLLTKGYLVEFVVLDGTWAEDYPPGLNVRFIFKRHSKHPLDQAKYLLHARSGKYMNSAIHKFLTLSKSRTVIISDDRFYALLIHSNNAYIKNRIRYSTISKELLKNLFPNVGGEH
ncbi:MAG: CDP-glycerol glycerophosphotransferase family protein [Defluviitaleaceae bacterium]|nr:CDP-glycerol glycerophosphotransferase family protein [Defluviitaleaceae bacterium]